jgi:hypothetical protein
MEINENISNNLRVALSKEISDKDLSSGSEGLKISSDMLKSIPNVQNQPPVKKLEMQEKKTKNLKTPLIKKSIKKSEVTDLIGKTKMKKPIGKLFSMGKTETDEATSSGASGQFSQPLFSEESANKKKLKKVETKEATGASSAGQYSTPKIWAKTMNKKDWKGASKTQIPGGKFVQVKKKCKKFPYCNQGDIKALNIFENEMLKRVIENVSKKYQVEDYVIKNIIAYEIGLIK